MKLIRCRMCGQPFRARADAMYCGSKCKMRAYRRSKPDWSGPFTQEEIRLCLEYHHPTADTQYGDEPLCSCSTRIDLAGYTDWTTDHFMERLLKLREIVGDGRQEAKQADTAQR